MNIHNPQVIAITKFFLRLIGLIYIFIIIFQNHEYITTSKYNENYNLPNPITENLENQIYKKEHIFYDPKKNRKIKTIEISLVKEKKPKFSFKNILYIQIDIYGNYFMICLLLFLIKDLENNFVILLGYYILIILLMTKVKILQTFFFKLIYS